MPRTELVRYPGVLTDWGGRFLNKSILKEIQVGNIVRVVSSKKFSKDWVNTAYYRIIKQCSKNKNWFVGICEDPYYGNLEESLVKNGEIRAFSIYHIMEIPLEWKGNQNLEKNARFFNKRRIMTGIWYFQKILNKPKPIWIKQKNTLFFVIIKIKTKYFFYFSTDWLEYICSGHILPIAYLFLNKLGFCGIATMYIWVKRIFALNKNRWILNNNLLYFWKQNLCQVYYLKKIFRKYVLFFVLLE